jgi:type II secretory pathway component PulF
MNKLELLYAKLSFRLNTGKRLAISQKLSSLLKNDFTLMNALQRIERIESKGGTKPNEPYALAIREWQTNLERGQSFAEATRGWIPRHETLMMTIGDVSQLSTAIDNVMKVGEGIERIKRAMLSAVAYPLFLLALTFGIIIMVGLYLVPPLADAAGGDIVWRGMAASLVWVADFSKDYWMIFAGVFAVAVLLGWISLANWSGRARAAFDNLPPWNMYKIQASVGWMMSLAAMVTAGGSIPVVMRLLADNATPYVRHILESALRYIANGDNLGVALANTGTHFPSDEIVGDLEIYAEMNDFDKNLDKIANDYLETSVKKMEAVSGAMNNIGILLVSVIIGWVVFGTFQMQDQITAALT